MNKGIISKKSKRLAIVLILSLLAALTLSAALTLTGTQTTTVMAASPWAPNTAYKIGDQVTYGGSTYQCIQAHTSQTGWEPPNVPALWKLIGTAPTPTATAKPAPTATPKPGSTPTPTTKPTATPVSGGNGSLPKHELTGYWQNFNNGAKVLKIKDVPTTYSLIVVAFADSDANNPGGVTFAIDSGLASALGGYTDANFISDIQAVHAQGRKVIISVGGQNGNVSLGSASPNVSNFVNSMYGLITKYGFDGVDIDLESGINVPNLTSAIQQLQAKVGSKFILTMAPQTIDVQPGGSYMPLITNLKSIITVVHTQYYNSGSMNGCNGSVVSQGSVDFITAQACYLLQTLRPDQVAFGLPASPSGAGSGYVSPTIVNNALDCISKGTNCGSYHPSTTYPTIRGAMDWSINWDASASYAFANGVTGHFSSLP